MLYFEPTFYHDQTIKDKHVHLKKNQLIELEQFYFFKLIDIIFDEDKKIKDSFEKNES